MSLCNFLLKVEIFIEVEFCCIDFGVDGGMYEFLKCLMWIILNCIICIYNDVFCFLVVLERCCNLY